MKLSINSESLSSIPIIPYKGIDKFAVENVSFEVSDDFIRDLKFYLSGAEQDNFTTLLIQLIFKADIDNKVILAKSYPEEVLTIWAYQNVKDFHLQLYENAN